jgi:hypothetical protein
MRVKSINKFEGYDLQNYIGRIYSMHGTKKNAYRILIGKPEGKRPLRRPRSRLVGNIEMDLRKIG